MQAADTITPAETTAAAHSDYILGREFPQDAIVDSIRQLSRLPSVSSIQIAAQASRPSLSVSPAWVESGLQLSAGLLAVARSLPIRAAPTPYTRSNWGTRSLPIRAVRCLGAAFRGGQEAVRELWLLDWDAALPLEQVTRLVIQEAMREVSSVGRNIEALLQLPPTGATAFFIPPSSVS